MLDTKISKIKNQNIFKIWSFNMVQDNTLLHPTRWVQLGFLVANDNQLLCYAVRWENKPTNVIIVTAIRHNLYSFNDEVERYNRYKTTDDKMGKHKMTEDRRLLRSNPDKLFLRIILMKPKINLKSFFLFLTKWQSLNRLCGKRIWRSWWQS